MTNIFDNFFQNEIQLDTLNYDLKNLIKAGPEDENDFEYFNYKDYLKQKISTLTFKN